MSRIPYHRIPPADAYQRVQQAQEARQPNRAEAPDAKPAGKPTEARATPSSVPADAAHALSKDEAAMIDRYFPAEPKTTLRLYGRAGAQTLQPTSLGSRLDLSA